MEITIGITLGKLALLFFAMLVIGSIIGPIFGHTTYGGFGWGDDHLHPLGAWMGGIGFFGLLFCGCVWIGKLTGL